MLLKGNLNLFFFFVCFKSNKIVMSSIWELKMYIGSWCLGFGLGNLDGWDGDYTIHLLSAGIFLSDGIIIIILWRRRKFIREKTYPALKRRRNFFYKKKCKKIVFFYLRSFSMMQPLNAFLSLKQKRYTNVLSWSQLSVSLQAGSLQLSPVSVEITYGLERILMLLQVSWLIFFFFN